MMSKSICGLSPLPLSSKLSYASMKSNFQDGHILTEKASYINVINKLHISALSLHVTVILFVQYQGITIRQCEEYGNSRIRPL